MLKNPKRSNQWSEKHCHYLASQYGKALILETVIKDETIASALVETMTGEQVVPRKRYNLNEVLQLLPHDDRAPSSTEQI